MDNTQQVRLIAKTRLNAPAGGTVDVGDTFYHPSAAHAAHLVRSGEAEYAPDLAAPDVELRAIARLTVQGRAPIEPGESFTIDAAHGHALVLAGEAEAIEAAP